MICRAASSCAASSTAYARLDADWDGVVALLFLGLDPAEFLVVDGRRASDAAEDSADCDTSFTQPFAAFLGLTPMWGRERRGNGWEELGVSGREEGGKAKDQNKRKETCARYTR